MNSKSRSHLQHTVPVPVHLTFQPSGSPCSIPSAAPRRYSYAKVAFSNNQMRQRGLDVSIRLCSAVAGFIITISSLNKAVRCFSVVLHVDGFFGPNDMVYTLAASALNRTTAKQAYATAIVIILSRIGNICSPTASNLKDALLYMLVVLMIVFTTISILNCIFTKTVLGRENKRPMGMEIGIGVKANQYTP